ncbi:Mismatch repair protein msh3 [Physocladia obscura]|uniref:MutS protein homolog 3 n=1 Tax=Physocladia obscura TaxID=109957 RepID=A0AAD5SN19_9FUNG|nr:Mismatch repair protein msh3 [Physocladia obscura]
MVLSGPTLKALEVFETEFAESNNDGKGYKGSLIWALDHTITKFGSRLLRKWIGKPLVNVEMLNQRVDAVEEVIKCVSTENIPIVKMRGLLHQIPDLEKSLPRIHYTRCPPSDLYATLTAFQKISSTFPNASIAQSFKSPILNTIFSRPASIASLVEGYITVLDSAACAKNRKHDVFLFSEDDDGRVSEKRARVKALKEKLRVCEAEFEKLLQSIRKKFKGGSAVEFVSVSGTDYLIEVKAANVGSVPKDWVCVSKLKAVSRFHTPEVLEQMHERDMIIEQLSIAADIAYTEFLGEVAASYQELRDVVQSLAIVDCLMSLAKVADQPGYTKPTYSADPVMCVKDGRHPMVEMLISNFVPNDISLTKNDRCLLITGPNMGGKSSYIRQVALLAIMGQIGSYVPATSAHLGIFDSIHTRMGAYDDITRGQSTFMKELAETSEIMHSATPRSLVIVDELGRGTSTHDGTAIAYSCLQYFLKDIKCATLFVTHYPVLGNVAGVQCAHVGFIADDDTKGDDGNDTTVTFLYKLTAGLANCSYGLNVARLAGIPETVVKSAYVQSKKLEALHEGKNPFTRKGLKVLKAAFV